jgi:toxin CptA
MLRIAIRPSCRLTLLLFLAHAAAFGACVAADMPVELKFLVVLLIGLSCAHALYGAALLRSRKAIVALEITDGGVLTFQTRSGEWRRGILLDSSFVAPYLTVLNLKTDGTRLARHVVIMADSVAAEEYRRLRVWLRWRKTAAVDEKI